MHGAERERLPNRRPAETFDIEVGGLRFTTTLGFYPNGKLGEVFLVNHKAGSQAGVMASDAAVLGSIALQYGAPLETLRKGGRNMTDVTRETLADAVPVPPTPEIEAETTPPEADAPASPDTRAL